MPKIKGVLLSTIILSIAILPALAHSQRIDGTVEKNEYPFSTVFDSGNYTLFWNMKDDVAHFGIRANTTGWVALGIDPTNVMENADMIFGWVDENGSAFSVDAFSTGTYGPHPPDEELGGTNDVIQFAATESKGVTTFEFARPLATGDAFDKQILPEGGNDLIWAFGNSDELVRLHVTRGKGKLVPEVEKIPILERLGILLLLHMSTRSLSFVLMVVGMLIARYSKKKRWWLKTHRVLGIVGTALGVVGLGFAVYMVSTKTGIHMRVVHAWFGAFAILVIILSPFFGQAFLKVKKDRKPFFRISHRWLGRIGLSFMLAAVVLGLFQAGIL